MVHALYPIWKCHHFRRTQPELMQRARYVSSLIEYLFEQLTGEAAVSKCIASGSGFLDIHTLDWHDELLELVHLERDQFAELKDGPHWAGLRASIAGELGLQPGIPVTVGFSDGAMNQVGIGGDEQGTMSFSVGTSGAIRTIASQPLIPETPSTWCYYLYNGKRLVGAATQGAGNCVDWFAGNLPEGAGGYQALERVAEEIDVEQAPFFLPFIYGERSPGWQDQRLGGFLDVRPQHGVGDFYHALLEGILFNIYHCYTILSGLVGEPKEILISGGIMHSQLWLQMAADIFQRVLLTTGVTDDSIIGMSVVALQALVQLKEGEYKPRTAVAANPQRGKRQAYQERFQKYLELYELNR